MGGGGGVIGNVIRAFEAVATAGISEVAQDKPFGIANKSAGSALKNVLTGGTLGLVKGAEKAASGKVSAGVLDAVANQGPAGNVLTPALGTSKSLAAQGIVAGAAGGAALGATGAASAAGGAGTTAVSSGVAGTGTGLGAASSSLSGAAIGTGAAVAGTAGASALTGKAPSLPVTNPYVSNNVDQAAKDAANAVQTADAEARRARAAKRQSSVLGNYQGFSATGISPATLQPASPRKSVLG